jgi:flagellar basal body-associated protein FliL
MDERTIKRLLIILVASIIAIMLLKLGLTKTYTTLNKAAAEKKQTAAPKSSAPQQAPAAPATAEIIETPATSSVFEATASDLPGASSVDETR